MEDCQSWIGNPIHQHTCIPSTPSELQSWAELSLTICTGWKWGIEPATFGVKVQHANHYATVTPLKILVKLFYLCYSPAIRAKDLLLVQTCFSIGIFCSLLIYLTLSTCTASWCFVRWPFTIQMNFSLLAGILVQSLFDEITLHWNVYVCL